MMRAFSHGGGTQSTAALVLAAQGKLSYRLFLFANVGEDSENPEVVPYLREVAMPYAARHGIDLLELHKERRGGRRETLLQFIERSQRTIPIPARMSNGAPGNRTCTEQFKIDVIAKWLRQHGATAEQPVALAKGISVDEWHRMRSDSGFDYIRVEYPLVDMRIDRAQCVEIIWQAGLPPAPKSSCWFCPYHSYGDWHRMRRLYPERFQQAVELERFLNDRRAMLGRDPVWLSQRCRPLDEAIGDQMLLDEMDEGMCESGYCHT